MTTSKYGLSRDIPLSVKRQIRSQCGYGCVVCGNAIYQYEHVDPPFAEAQHHDPDGIALLCGHCHDCVTRGVWSKEKIKEARQNPICRQQGFSRLGLDVTTKDRFIIKIGSTEFVNLGPVIRIDDQEILAIGPPEEPDSPPVISATFFDRENNEVARIVENEWRGSTEAFDIETRGDTISIRSGSGKIDLVLKLQPPRKLIVERMQMRYGDTAISGSSSDGFVATTKSAQISIPSKPTRIEKAPYWLSCADGKVSLGSDSILTMVEPDGSQHQLAGTIDVSNLEVEWVDPIEEGIEPPPNWQPGRRVMKTRSTGESGYVSFKPSWPLGTSAKPSRLDQGAGKTGRNDPCPCGSGKKYKKCCGR